MMYSLGCNTDITIGAMAELKKKRAKGEKVAVVVR
jgi:ABC-type sugar transport system substrate-binding protein